MLLGIHISNVEPSLCNKQHLYIISDDEIKESDWFIHHSHGITTLLKAIEINNKIVDNQGTLCSKYYCKKIIATTDTSLNETDRFNGKLWNNLLPQLSQQFIEKYIEYYNKGEVITDVLVEYEDYEQSWLFIGYKEDGSSKHPIINRLKVNPKDNTITIKKLKDNFTLNEIEKALLNTKLLTTNEFNDIWKIMKENLG